MATHSIRRVAAQARDITMKPLRPITILGLGSVLTGMVFAFVMVVGQRDMLTWRGVGIAFGCGSLGGLIILAPIAAGEAFRKGLARFLGPHVFRVEWYVSLLMAAAMGYLVASMRHRAFDRPFVVAMVVVFIGALIKTLLGVVYDRSERGGAGRVPSGGAP